MASYTGPVYIPDPGGGVDDLAVLARLEGEGLAWAGTLTFIQLSADQRATLGHGTAGMLIRLPSGRSGTVGVTGLLAADSTTVTVEGLGPAPFGEQP
jgi:hypothetical protein